MSGIQHNKKGGVLLLLILVLASVASIAFLLMARAGVDTFMGSQTQTDTQETRGQLYGCLDEALIQFQRDENFFATEISVGEESCDLEITTPLAGQRQLILFLTQGSITRSLSILITLPPVMVVSVEE